MGYNLFAIPFCSRCLLPLDIMACPSCICWIMMAFSSVSVVTSSLFLRCYSKPRIGEDGVIYSQGLVGHVQRFVASIMCRMRNNVAPRGESVQLRSEWEIELV